MILIVDKPAGMTSQRVVSEMKRLLGKQVKAGHTGTLDPMCTGVLPVLTDADTKLNEFLPKDKEYIAEFQTGILTDTQDTTGQILETCDKPVSEEDVLRVLPSFTGAQKQVPPMYSAIRVEGKHLYELARKGIVLEREAREIVIYDIEYLGSPAPNTFRIRVACSPGTYIRTLCEDIGRALGTCAAMSSLRRTKSNGFSIADAHTLEEWKEAFGTNGSEAWMLSAEQVLSYLEKTVVPEDGRKFFINGGAIALGRLKAEADLSSTVRAYAEDGTFLALAEKTEKGLKAVWLNR